MGMRKRNMGLDFTYYLCITFQVRTHSANFVNKYADFGTPQYLWNDLS